MEGTQVRLVRCPKCDNLLPELPDVPVYQCGGCGTALQVKMKSISNDGSSEKSNEEREKMGFEKTESCDRKINGVDIDNTQRKEKEENSSSSSSSSLSSRLTEKRELLTEIMATSTTGYSSKYRRSSKAPIEDHNMNMNKDEFMKVNTSKETREMKPQSQTGIASLSYRSDPKRDGLIMNSRTKRIGDECARTLSSTYPDEGPSNYQKSGCDYSYGEPISNSGSNSRYGESNLNPNNVSRRVEYHEQDRAELLQKLQELQDQLRKSCNVNGEPKEKVLFDGRSHLPEPCGGPDGRDFRLPVDSPGSIRASRGPFLPDEQVRRPLYFDRSHDQVPLTNRPDLDLPNFYHPMHTPTEIHGYHDSYGHPIHGRVPNQPTDRFPHGPYHDYNHGRYMDFDRDAVYPNNTFFHQPACSCYQCYNKHFQIPPLVQPTLSADRRFLNGPSRTTFYGPESRETFRPQAYYPEDTNPPPLRRHRHPRARMSTDFDSEFGGVGGGRVERPVVAKRSGRRYYPVEGGAPFVTCYNCLQLLQLPRKFLQMERKERKLKCGACSTIITISMESKNLVCTKNENNYLEANDEPLEAIQEGNLHSYRQANRDITNSYSEDYDNSGHNPKLNLSEAEKLHDIPSTSSSTSEGEGSPDCVVARVVPPLPGSSLCEHFEYSSYQRLVDKLEKGNKSKHMNQEEMGKIKSTSRQNSLKDASLATEMEVSFNEYSNTGTSQDSNEATREEDQSKNSKGGMSFFAGLIKKGLREATRSNHIEENEVSSVSVNGKPIPNWLVKKAEKRAGRIHPGQYWYDVRAGFWGVMGQPCLGIIPPSIEEFNYPMPKNCAGGDTGIFVNGRELHHNDLDLLASRGLPTTKDKSYIIEITGTVVEENSGQELESLGKLAPTIEKLKHGFGMKAPQIAA